MSKLPIENKHNTYDSLQAFQDLEKIIGDFPEDFNYDRELDLTLEERYGRSPLRYQSDKTKTMNRYKQNYDEWWKDFFGKMDAAEYEKQLLEFESFGEND